MPEDNRHPDEIVLAKDLKPGDCVRSSHWIDHGEESNAMGIIVASTFCNDSKSLKLKKFYSHKNAISQYDINCPSDGPYSTPVDAEKEYKVIHSRKEIIYTYRTIEHRLLSMSADLMNQRNELMKVQEDAVGRMNDRLDKIRKER